MSVPDRERMSSKMWYSHKFNHAALRYEVGVSIINGDIVWLHGPFPAGRWPDIKIFRHALVSYLEDGERVEADNGYIGEAPTFVKCPKDIANPAENEVVQNIVRSRHETVNKRFKQWGCLSQTYRHDLLMHGDIFRSVAIITQMSIQSGEHLFSVQYP